MNTVRLHEKQRQIFLAGTAFFAVWRNTRRVYGNLGPCNLSQRDLVT